MGLFKKRRSSSASNPPTVPLTFQGPPPTPESPQPPVSASTPGQGYDAPPVLGGGTQQPAPGQEEPSPAPPPLGVGHDVQPLAEGSGHGSRTKPAVSVRRIVVVGGAQEDGLGLHVAMALVQEGGFEVVLTGSDKRAYDKVLEASVGREVSAAFVEMDMDDLGSVDRGVDAMIRDHIPIHGVVLAHHNSGFGMKNRSATVNRIEVLFQHNALAPLRLVLGLVPQLEESFGKDGYARIIFIASNKKKDEFLMSDPNLERWTRAKAMGHARFSLYCFNTYLSHTLKGITTHIVDCGIRSSEGRATNAPISVKVKAKASGTADDVLAREILSLLRRELYQKKTGLYMKGGERLFLNGNRSHLPYATKVYKECCEVLEWPSVLFHTPTSVQEEPSPAPPPLGVGHDVQPLAEGSGHGSRTKPAVSVRRIVVVGGAQEDGLGLHVAMALVQEGGFEVVLTGSDKRAYDKAVHVLEASVGREVSAAFVEMDMDDLGSVDRGVDAIIRDHIPIHGVVLAHHNSGFGMKNRFATVNRIEVLFQHNALAPLRLVLGLVPQLEESFGKDGYARIIFIASNKKKDEFLMSDPNLARWTRAKAMGHARFSLYCFNTYLSHTLKGITTHIVDCGIRSSEGRATNAPISVKVKAKASGTADDVLAREILSLLRRELYQKKTGLYMKGGESISLTGNKGHLPYATKVYKECCELLTGAPLNSSLPLTIKREAVTGRPAGATEMESSTDETDAAGALQQVCPVSKICRHKTVLVIGAEGEVGQEITHLVCQLGFRVVMHVTSERQGKELQGQLRDRYDTLEVYFVVMDLGWFSTVDEGILDVFARFRSLHAVVFAEYQNGYDTKKRSVSRDDIEVLFQHNALAPLRLVLGLVPQLEESFGKDGYARIIFIASNKKKDEFLMSDPNLERWTRAKAMGHARFSLYCFNTYLKKMLPKGMTTNIVDPGIRQADASPGANVVDRHRARHKGHPDARIADLVRSILQREQPPRHGAALSRDRVYVMPQGKKGDYYHSKAVVSKCCELMEIEPNINFYGGGPMNNSPVARWAFDIQRLMGVDGAVDAHPNIRSLNHVDIYKEDEPPFDLLPEDKQEEARAAFRSHQESMELKGKGKKKGKKKKKKGGETHENIKKAHGSRSSSEDVSVDDGDVPDCDKDL